MTTMTIDDTMKVKYNELFEAVTKQRKRKQANAE